MDDDKLIEIARSFEADAVDSKTHIKNCKPQHLVGLTANRAGFLRLAASCLRAATEPIVDDGPSSISPRVDLPIIGAAILLAVVAIVVCVL